MSTISAKTTFRLDLNPKVFNFLDTTDWAGQGIPLANVNGCFSIVTPSGVTYYNNTNFSNAGCDIRMAVSLNNQIPINLPLNSEGVVEPGTYIITYTTYNSVTLLYSTQQYSLTYNYSSPVISINNSADCLSPLFLSVDNTDYVKTGTVLTMVRTHTLYFPAGSAGFGSPITSTGATIPTSVFYPGTQTTSISTTLSYVFADGLVVQDLVSGSKAFLVDCKDVCNIMCCIINFESQMTSMRTSNYQKYLDDFRYQWTEIMGYVGMIRLAISCGDPADVSGYLQKIKDIANCTDACCTAADNFAPVQGLGAINVIVQSGGLPVVVTAVVAAGTTTYTITLSDAFIAKVNNSYNSIVAPGDNIGVTVVTAVDGTKTYTVNGKKAIVAAGAGIAVSASAEVAGVITYTVSVAATGYRATAENPPLVINNANGNLNADIEVNAPGLVIPANGDYELFAFVEYAKIAYVSAVANAANLILKIKVNGVTKCFSYLSLNNIIGEIEDHLTAFTRVNALIAGDDVKMYLMLQTPNVDEVATMNIGDYRMTVKRVV